MKKYLFIFLSILLVSVTYAHGFKFMGGLNLSKYAVEPEVSAIEWKNKTGFLAGAGIDISLVPNIAIEIDALYFQKGSKVEVLGVEQDYTLNVISIPALLRIKFLPGPSPYILGGGEFSLILSHEFEEEDIKENFKSFDYGLVFGAGFEMKMPGASIFIEGRYNIGMNNIIKDPVGDESIKTKAIVVIVGIKI